jgi:ADP-ribose pyrophosphatase YjhB (NUDIX family)
MNSVFSDRKTVFETPWFKILAGAGDKPHYVLQCPDFASVVALDPQGRLLLVRQFRHGAGQTTLEVPAGHVEEGETPEEAARKELLEETGHEADSFELLGMLSPSTARFTNRLWCFFANGVRLAPDHKQRLEEGLDPVHYSGSLRQLMNEPEFFSAGTHASLLRAILHGKLKID